MLSRKQSRGMLGLQDSTVVGHGHPRQKAQLILVRRQPGAVCRGSEACQPRWGVSPSCLAWGLLLCTIRSSRCCLLCCNMATQVSCVAFYSFQKEIVIKDPLRAKPWDTEGTKPPRGPWAHRASQGRQHK